MPLIFVATYQRNSGTVPSRHFDRPRCVRFHPETRSRHSSRDPPAARAPLGRALRLGRHPESRQLMTTSILRTAGGWWVQTADVAARIATPAATTGELLTHRTAIDAAVHPAHPIRVNSLRLSSPVSVPCRVVAQMTNFASHVKGAGMDPKTIPLTFFRKTSGSITGPFGTIIKPPHVELLDYEAEIGLVIGRDIPVGTEITESNLADFIAGLVVTNDISARDIQLTKTQFYEAKSYPTFTPVGPALVLLDAEELNRFGDLRLELQVNGEVRQNMLAHGDMIYPPLQALQSLARFQPLGTGDLIMTGTPVGTALGAPPQPSKLQAFLAHEASNPKYLQHGDIVEVSIATNDDAIDLGTQRSAVRYA